MLLEDAASCTTGFVSEVISVGVSHAGEQWVFPNINFTCRGEVIGVTFGGSNFKTRDDHPEFQIWRRNEGDHITYTKVGGVPLIVAATLTGGVYTIPVAPGQLQFEKDDVLGVFLQHNNLLSIRLVFDVAGPSGYYTSVGNGILSSEDIFTLGGAIRENVLPFIAVEIGKKVFYSCRFTNYMWFLTLQCQILLPAQAQFPAI